MNNRELDAKVAEEVFDKPPSYYHCPHFDKDGRILSFCSCPDLPRYSSDISAAWLVVEKMERMDHNFSLKNIIPSSDPPVYIARFSGRGLLDGFATEFTAPLAICRAALKAVEEEK